MKYGAVNYPIKIIGLAPHGAQWKEDGNMRLPLFRLPAISSAMAAAAVTVFAQFVS